MLGILLLSKNYVGRANVSGYQKKIKELILMYGAENEDLVWPVLYQADVRARSERMATLATRV